MEDVVIVRYSEIAVKGASTRDRMERLLVNAIKESLRRRGVRVSSIVRSDGRIFLWSPTDPLLAAKASSRVFGVKSSSPAKSVVFRNIEELVDSAADFFKTRVKGKVFRVRARRVGAHDFTSKDVERLLGSRLLEEGALRVDLTNPEYTAYVEIRGNRAFFYDELIEGPGGLPIGSEGKVLVLYSGGFDSTVTAWRLMKRGCMVDLVYFDMGNKDALKIAVTAAKFLADEWAFGYEPTLYVVRFSGPSMIVSGKVRSEYRLLVLRRLMMEYAERLAESIGAEALATGESVGQVASQTIRSLYVISRGLKLPVLRPMAGMDKDEIVNESRRIGVYDIVSKQIEVCGQAPTPTPRPSPAVFEEEYSKVLDLLKFVPEPKPLSLKRKGLKELLAEVGLGG